jgi:hypothetical protein
MPEFGVGLPLKISLPHHLPRTDGRGTDRLYHQSAENVEAAFWAGVAYVQAQLDYTENELRAGVREYDAPTEGERPHHRLALSARRALSELERVRKPR